MQVCRGAHSENGPHLCRDRTELEVFNGPHTIHGVGTYKFLHKHLNWPEPK